MPKEWIDPSNARIDKVLKKVSEVMAEEQRGFIFAPIVNPKGNHKPFFRAQFLGSEFTHENLFEFWATMLAIVDNFHASIPEDLVEDYEEGFDAFVETVKKFHFDIERDK